MQNIYLVTGSAGFIGFHLSQRLLAQGAKVVGVDNLNNYYSVELKESRLAILKKSPNFEFHKIDIAEKKPIFDLFKKYKFTTVFHLAAQAGVRYSLENPEAYITANIDGTLNILEGARHSGYKPHLLMASSSSVYGLSTRLPFSEDDPADQPVALYGATKRANELMAHSYSHLYGLRTTLLRFFTVYGPWGRPDMALFKFTKQILAGEEVELYNNGDMVRDFTYIDDIIDGILGLDRTRNTPQQPLYDVYNIGCSRPRTLMEFVVAIEKSTGKKAKTKMMPFQPGDVHKTAADVSKLNKICGYQSRVDIETGIQKFVEWYREYFKI